MKIFTVNCHFKDILLERGHEVLEFNPVKSGVYNVNTILHRHAFSPDIILQKDNLGSKVLLAGLHAHDCKKAFWSIDTHLNYFWQLYYAQLFDVFFTPHKDYLAKTAPFCNNNKIYRLPNYAPQRPFTRHKDRPHAINMVGRMSNHRSCRNNLHKLLKEFYNTDIVSNISYSEMLKLYDNSRIIPNESIAFETNFRILEGAACGCCVISPDIGPDQNELFEVNKEILIYNDATQLLHSIDTCLEDVNYTEDIGRAAWERVQKEHLLQHRVHSILEVLEQATPSAEKSEDGLNASITLLAVSRQINISCPDYYCENIHNDILKCIISITKMIFSKCERSKIDAQIAFAQNLLEAEHTHDHTLAESLAILCGGYTLRNKNLDLSHTFHEIYKRIHENNETNSRFTGTEDDMYSLWIDSLSEDGRGILYGTSHDGYLQTAADFILMYVQREAIESLWASQLLSLDAMAKTYPQLAQGAAARLTLNEPSLESHIRYIKESLRFLDTETAAETIREVLTQLPAQSRIAFKKVLLKQLPYWEKILAVHHISL